MRRILHISYLIGSICNAVYSFTFSSRYIIRAADSSITQQHKNSYQRTSVSHQPLYMSDNQQQQQEVPTIRQDYASTLPQLLHSLWGLISYASKSMIRGVSYLYVILLIYNRLLTLFYQLSL